MTRRLAALLTGLAIAFAAGALSAQVPQDPPSMPDSGRHTFSLGRTDFLLDGKPFQIICCEMHPARIPAEYWTHRIRMAKAMGCNTIAAYIFWNYHEPEEGKFDFTTGNHDLARFIKTAQQEGLWVLLRPGPYVCAEWDFGGIPPYLLKDPELRVRSLYPRYMQAAERYMAQLARVVRPLLVTRGGPILMVQVENEYGSYGNDRNYMIAAARRVEDARDRRAVLHRRRPDAVHARGRAACRAPPSVSIPDRTSGIGNWRVRSCPACRCFRRRRIPAGSRTGASRGRRRRCRI